MPAGRPSCSEHHCGDHHRQEERWRRTSSLSGGVQSFGYRGRAPGRAFYASGRGSSSPRPAASTPRATPSQLQSPRDRLDERLASRISLRLGQRQPGLSRPAIASTAPPRPGTRPAPRPPPAGSRRAGGRPRASRSARRRSGRPRSRGLDRDHPECLREGARHQQRLGAGQQLRHLVVLEPADELDRGRDSARRLGIAGRRVGEKAGEDGQRLLLPALQRPTQPRDLASIVEVTAVESREQAAEAGLVLAIAGEL